MNALAGAVLPARVTVTPDLRDGQLTVEIRHDATCTLVFGGPLAGALRLLTTGDYHPARAGSPALWERRPC